MFSAWPKNAYKPDWQKQALDGQLVLKERASCQDLAMNIGQDPPLCTILRHFRAEVLPCRQQGTVYSEAAIPWLPKPLTKRKPPPSG